MHRPSNVDEMSARKLNIDFINEVSKKIKVICPIHHRMKEMVKKLDNTNFIAVKPLNYIDFLSLENYAKFVITDSGGVQEETSFLNVPCFTLRNNTERPVTIDIGTNQLIDANYNDFEKKLGIALSNNSKKKQLSRIPLWDGSTSERIKHELLYYLEGKMKIAYLHDYFTTPEGSSGTRSYEFAKRLVDCGHEVSILCSNHDRFFQEKKKHLLECKRIKY